MTSQSDLPFSQHKELTREEDYALKCTCIVKGRLLAQVIVQLELNLATLYTLCIPLTPGALDSEWGT
jgi:hypothetical protein